MPARASSPVALRAGSADPRRTRSEPSVPATSSAQVYVVRGQPSACEADGTMPTATGEEATESDGETGMPSPSPLARSSHSSESGSQTWKSGWASPAARAAATLCASRARTSTSRQRPSALTSSARARSATDRTAGAMSGEATTDRCTAESSQDSENDHRPPLAATAVPVATERTSRVAITTVRRRRPGRGWSRRPSAAWLSGKL